MSEPVRLHVVLAQAGVASRRACEKLIAQGKISVNGVKVTKQGVKVDPEKDTIAVDQKPLKKLSEKKRYFLFNKPVGVVTTLKDEHADKTVADFFRDIPEKIVPVGRLDKNSTGLLLMTNDGDLVHRLTHPSFEIERTYRVKIKGKPSPADFKRLEKGVILYEKKTAPCKISVLSETKEGFELHVTLHEGMKREIREMMKLLGARVRELERLTYGPFKLAGLRQGFRLELTAQEISRLEGRHS